MLSNRTENSVTQSRSEESQFPSDTRPGPGSAPTPALRRVLVRCRGRVEAGNVRWTAEGGDRGD